MGNCTCPSGIKHLGMSCSRKINFGVATVFLLSLLSPSVYPDSSGHRVRAIFKNIACDFVTVLKFMAMATMILVINTEFEFLNWTIILPSP